MRRNMSALMLGTLAALLLSGCASTTFKSTWENPQAGPIRFTKTLAVYMSSNEAERRSAEDRLVEKIGPQRSAPSYSLLSGAEVRDTAAAKQKVRAAGFDGVVVMRAISERKEVSYVPPRHYGSYSRYSGRAWGAVYEPGYLRTDRFINVETNIYSLADDTLIWSGISETFEPGRTTEMVGEVADAAAAELRRRGLLAAK